MEETIGTKGKSKWIYQKKKKKRRGVGESEKAELSAPNWGAGQLELNGLPLRTWPCAKNVSGTVGLCQT